MAPVFGLSHLSRRLVESVVGLFAVLGFVYVPLGRHTGFEHVKAVLSTPAAAAAIDDLCRTGLDLRRRAVDFVTQRPATPRHPPETDGDGKPPSGQARDPRPLPPKLR